MGAISDFVSQVNAERAGRGDVGGGLPASGRGSRPKISQITDEEREEFNQRLNEIIESGEVAPQTYQSGSASVMENAPSVLDIITGGSTQEPPALQQAVGNVTGGSPFTTKTGINLGPGIDLSGANPVRGAAEDTYKQAEAEYNKTQDALKTALQNAPGDIDYETDPTISAARAAAKKAEDDLRIARDAYEQAGGMGHSYSMEDRASDIVKGAAGSTAASDVDAVRAIWEKGGNQREMRRAEEEAKLADLDASVQRAQIRLDDLMRTTHGDTSNPAVQQAMERLRQEQDFRNRYVNSTNGAFNVDKLNAVTGKATALADELAAGSAQNIARSKEGLGRVGRALVDAGVSGTQMLMDTAVSAMTGGMISPEMAMAMRSFGGGTMQARQGGGDIDQQLMYGGATATLEVLTEHMFDGVAGIYGKGAADDVVEDVIRRMTSSDIGRTALRKLFNAGGEGAEELISAAVTPTLDAIYNGKSVGENYSEMDVSESLYDGLVGFLVGLAGGGASYIAGQDASKNAELRVQDAGLGNVSSQVDNAMDVLFGNVTPEQQAAREAAAAENLQNNYGGNIIDEILNRRLDNYENVERTAPVTAEQRQAQAAVREIINNGRINNTTANEIANNPALREAFSYLTGVSLDGLNTAQARAAIQSAARDSSYLNQQFQAQQERVQAADQARAQTQQMAAETQATEEAAPPMQTEAPAEAETGPQLTPMQSYVRGMLLSYGADPGSVRIRDIINNPEYREAFEQLTGITLDQRSNVAWDQVRNAAQSLQSGETTTIENAAQTNNPVLDVIQNGEVQQTAQEAQAPIAEAEAPATETPQAPAPAVEQPAPAPAPVTEQAAEAGQQAEQAENPGPFHNPDRLNTRTQEREGRFSSNTLNRVEKEAGIPKKNRGRFTYETKSEGQSVAEAAARLENDRSGEVQKLRDSEAWSGVQTDMARQIANELWKAGELDAYYEWRKVMNDHLQEGGRGIQALAKDTRKDGQSAVDKVIDAISENEDLTPEQRAKILENAKKASEQYDAAQKDVARAKAEAKDGGSVEAPQSLINLILDISEKRNTGTIIGKNLKKLLNSQKGNVDYLSDLAYNQILAMSSDYTQKRTLAEYVKTFQTLAQLTSLATFNRNILGNVTFGSMVDVLAKDGFGVAFDRLMSKKTGKRTVALDKSFFSSEYRKGALDGMQKSALEVALDVDMEGGESANKYGRATGRTFKMSGNAVERFFSRWEQLLNYSLTTSDKTSRAAMNAENARGLNALENNGLTEAEIEALNENEADYRLFQNHGAAYTFSKGVHDVFNVFGFGGKGDTIVERLKSRARGEGGFGVGDFVNTYPGVPANLGVKALEYSPANVVKGGAELFGLWKKAKAGGDIDAVAQYNAIMDTARGLAGVPIIALFAAAAKAGLLKNWDDEENKDAKALNAAEGKSGIQINLDAIGRWLKGEKAEWKDGDTLDSVGYLEPLNAFMGIGTMLAGMDEDATKGEYAKRYARGAIQSFLDIPVMSNLSNMVDAYQYADEEDFGGKIGQAALAYAGNSAIGFVPQPIRGVAKGLDEYYRDTSGENLGEQMENSFLNTIPVARESLPGKLDNFGNPKEYGGSTGGRLLNSLVNPGERTELRQGDESEFVFGLRDATGDEGVIPSRKAPNKLDFGGEDGSVDLTPDEQRLYQQTYGNAAQAYVREMMDDDLFNTLDPSEQAAVIKELYGMAKQEAIDAVREVHGYEGNPNEYAELLAGKTGPDNEVKKPALERENLGEYVMFNTAVNGALKNGDYDSVESLFGNFQNLNANTQAVLAAGGNDVATYVGLVNGKGKEGDSDYVPPLAVENVGDWAEFHNSANAAISAENFEELGNLFNDFAGMDENLREVLTARDDNVGTVARLVTGTKKPNPDQNIPPLEPSNLGEYFNFDDDIKDATKNKDYAAIDEAASRFHDLDPNTQEVLLRSNPANMKDIVAFNEAGSSAESYYKLKGEVGDAQWDMEASGQNAHVKLAGLASTDIPDEEKDALVSSGAFNLSKTGKSAYEILRGIDMAPGDISQWFENADWYAKDANTEPSADGTLNPYEVAVAISRIPGLNDASRTTLFNQFKQALLNPTNKQDAWKNKSYMKTLRAAPNYGRTVGNWNK